MAENLNGTVALVTGASSGIGRSTARQLAAAGASVAIVARRADRLEELASELDANGATVLTIAADLTDSAAAEAAVERTVAELGRLDTVVNAAGLMLNGPTEELTLGDWDRMVDINLRGLLYVTKPAIPHLLAAAQDGPRRVADLVNVSSVAGRFAAATTAGYNATKFGVTALTEALRQEFAPRHLRVSVIEPGRVDTELFDHREGSAEGFTAMFGQIEYLQPENIAEAVSYIVTNPRHVAINEIQRAGLRCPADCTERPRSSPAAHAAWARPSSSCSPRRARTSSSAICATSSAAPSRRGCASAACRSRTPTST